MTCPSFMPNFLPCAQMQKNAFEIECNRSASNCNSYFSLNNFPSFYQYISIFQYFWVSNKKFNPNLFNLKERKSEDMFLPKANELSSRKPPLKMESFFFSLCSLIIVNVPFGETFSGLWSSHEKFSGKRSICLDKLVSCCSWPLLVQTLVGNFFSFVCLFPDQVLYFLLFGHVILSEGEWYYEWMINLSRRQLLYFVILNDMSEKLRSNLLITGSPCTIC